VVICWGSKEEHLREGRAGKDGNEGTTTNPLLPATLIEER
jgi:hypothetical protein